jgi:hypothetical protein
MARITSQHVVAAGLALSLGGCLSAEAERRGLLAECTFNDECQSPLLCAARQCRAPCRTDRDCSNGWRCRSAGQDDKFVCYEPTRRDTGCVRSSDCDPPLVCGPTRECIFQCRNDYDCRVAYPYEPGARCIVVDSTCDAHPIYVRDAGATGQAVDP